MTSLKGGNYRESCRSGRHRIIPRREAEFADNQMARAERQICLKATSYDKRSLLYKENLTPPSFQLIVMTANMECNRCKGRVSQVVSKMTGLTEYTLDVRKKQVTVKGDFVAHCNFQDETIRSSTLKSAIHPPKCLFTCFTHFDKHLI